LKIIDSSRKKIIEPCSLDFCEYQIDPYVGCEHKCYYCYTQNEIELDWDNEVGIIPDLEKRLKEELSSLSPQLIYMGMNTDPYQPIEKELNQTRKVLEILKEKNFSVCMLTRSDLVTRDIDLFREMLGSSVGVSVAFQDERVRKIFEENTIPNKDRIKAIENFKQAGIETYVLICPVFPYITDVEVLINETRHCADAIWIYSLDMENPENKNWKRILPILEKNFPKIYKEFKEVVSDKDHPYWRNLRRKLEHIRDKENINLKIFM